MLKQFSASGFRCLYDLQLDLEPLTVLIGPNDSGKSSILECLSTLSRICRYELNDVKYFQGKHDLLENMSKAPGEKKGMDLSARYDQPSGGYEDVAYSIGLEEEKKELRIRTEALQYDKNQISWRQPDATIPNMIEGTKGQPGQSVSYMKRFQSFAIDPGVPEKDRAVLQTLGSIEAYSLRTESLCRPCRSTLEPEMCEDGEGLSAVLESFALAEREMFEDIEEALCRFSPMVKGLKVRPVGSQNDVSKVVHVVLENGVEVAANMMSDGLLYALGYLTLINSTSKPFALLVEEPENGIHPENLDMIMSFFRDVSEGRAGGSPVQVVISTHSPYLLDLAAPEEVRIVTRTMEEGTRVSTMHEVEGLRERLREFKLGELWTSVGDEALARGASK